MPCFISASAHITDGADTDTLLSAISSGNFITDNNGFTDTGHEYQGTDTAVASYNLTTWQPVTYFDGTLGNSEVEVEYSLQISSTYASATDTFDFRVQTYPSEDVSGWEGARMTVSGAGPATVVQDVIGMGVVPFAR